MSTTSESGSVLSTPTLVPEMRISRPSVGDVIVCAAFATGWRKFVKPDEWEEGPIWVTDAPGPRPYAKVEDDLERGTAHFVVEEVFKTDDVVIWEHQSRGGGYGDPFTYEETRHAYPRRVIASRLAADGTYDELLGERIQFDVWNDHNANDPFRHRIEIVQKRATLRAQAILDAPIYKIGTMRRIVRFV